MLDRVFNWLRPARLLWKCITSNLGSSYDILHEVKLCVLRGTPLFSSPREIRCSGICGGFKLAWLNRSTTCRNPPECLAWGGIHHGPVNLHRLPRWAVLLTQHNVISMGAKRSEGLRTNRILQPNKLTNAFQEIACRCYIQSYFDHLKWAVDSPWIILPGIAMDQLHSFERISLI